MSNYHVLEGSRDGTSYRVAFHVPTPASVNRAGVTIKTALTEDPDHTSASVVPNIGATETSQLISGDLFEHVFSFKTHPSHTALGDRNRLDSLYTSMSGKIQTTLEKKYAFWRFERDVP